MTPQEEQALVRIIVQCVRAVLEAAEQEAVSTRLETKPGVATTGSRFIDVVPRQGNHNAAHNGRQNGHGRDDVRESLRRFLRDSEPVVPERATIQQPQKRQLITQEDVLAALRQGSKVIILQPNAVVTPLARQVAKEKGIELR
ncbi:MAG: hypothetical protein ACRDIV_25610 [Ktedonobacteraceae bacterium]